MNWLRLSALPPEARREEIERHLRARAMPEGPQVAGPLSELVALPICAIAADRVLEHLSQAASPRRAILALQDSVQTLEAQRGDASPVFIEPVLALITELSGASARAARLIGADPALAVELAANLAPETHRTEEPFAEELTALVAECGDETTRFEAALRRYRNAQMLRIALRELRGADVRSTSAELADLASAAMQAALDHHHARLVAQYGAPEPACAHVVMGMGKLGGQELNFSSDIDVIYLYEHDEGGAGDLSMHQFHVKLFERATAALAAITEHGMVFRVDLDLRPEGRRGPLANSIASAERYYETWGRTWERAAWIKARAIAGDTALGQSFIDTLRPFVFRRSFDLKAIKEIVEMKAKIDREQKKAQMSRIGRGLSLKLGRGGIREIEFFVQAHQLLYAGRNPALRLQKTLEALAHLEAAGLVNARTRELLTDAYLFLRKLEHRIQIVEEQQTHVLPADPEHLTHIARSLAFETGEALRSALDVHMGEVHEVFASLLGRVEDEEGPDPVAELLVEASVPREERVAQLRELGAVAPESALANLETAMRFSGSPLHPAASGHDQRIGLTFLSECLASPSVDRALTHLPDLLRRLAIHGSYLSELDRQAVRRGIARVLGSSDLLARILTSSPALLSQVLLKSSLPDLEALEVTLRARLDGLWDDTEQALAILRVFKQEETLRTALADLAGRIEQPEVARRLTALAEIVVRVTLDLAFHEAKARFGLPKDPAAGLVVLAGGTLGAKEIGYRSDVDLSIVYDGEGETEGARRPPVGLQEFYTRLVQRLVTFLTMRMPQGDLYPVDMRLRPSGSQGPLVATLRNFKAYHQKEAHLWERQALVRTRVIAGREAPSKIVQEALHQSTYGTPLPYDARALIHEMRERMAKQRAHRGRRTKGRALDLKLGAGGLVELEFAVQYLLLRHGGQHPEIRTPSTREAFARLAEAGLLDPELAERLVPVHDFLRKTQNWLRLAHDEMLDHLDLAPESLRPLALAVGYAGEDAQQHMLRDLEADTALVTQTYEAVLSEPGT